MQIVRVLQLSVLDGLGGETGLGEGFPGILVMDLVGFVGLGQGGCVGLRDGRQAS